MMQKNYEKAAAAITYELNNISFDPQKLCEALGRTHRTLQQNFTRVCIAWLKYCAAETYAFDLRNEASHLVAKKLYNASPDAFSDSLPFI